MSRSPFHPRVLIATVIAAGLVFSQALAALHATSDTQDLTTHDYSECALCHFAESGGKPIVPLEYIFAADLSPRPLTVETAKIYIFAKFSDGRHARAPPLY